MSQESIPSRSPITLVEGWAVNRHMKTAGEILVAQFDVRVQTSLIRPYAQMPAKEFVLEFYPQARACLKMLNSGVFVERTERQSEDYSQVLSRGKSDVDAWEAAARRILREAPLFGGAGLGWGFGSGSDWGDEKS
jgi:hypothetical protein